jgi:ribonuclease Z
MTRSPMDDMSVLSRSAETIINAVGTKDRLLLFGPPGSGKSTLASELARDLSRNGRNCRCIGADPGSPAFGIPGALARGRWSGDGWQVEKYEALCTLDAGRFRAPLLSGVRRLSSERFKGVLLIDGPGVVRGVAGSELLSGIIEAAAADAVIALTAADRPPPLLDELRSLGLPVFVVHAADEAKRPGKRVRVRARTALWDAYLADAAEQTLDIEKMNRIGTPPPFGEPSAWSGRQIAFLDRGRTLVMGEVKRLEGSSLTVLLPRDAEIRNTVLVRDALRRPEGLIETAEPFAAGRIDYLPPADTVPGFDENGGPRVAARVGHVEAALLNGVFGDPLLHLRLREQRRGLLFDLGDGARLPARLAHQVTDVFISHAHMDHISGFQWLLRSRLSGDPPPCRIYGPPGIAGHIEGFVNGFLWDRIGDQGPVFDIAELHGDRLRCFQIRAGGPGRESTGEKKVNEGVLLDEPGFRVRTVRLDHHTAVLAFLFEPEIEIKVRKERLSPFGFDPGPWLSAMKQHLLAGERGAMIALPDGSCKNAGSLGDELVVIKPGKNLVYATDLAVTPENREKLATLARNAHTFFCESPFLEADKEQALRTGHLTARACGEIAAEAQVARLVPFHFSRRYSGDPRPIYEEIKAVCGCVAVPKDWRLFQATDSEDPTTKEMLVEDLPETESRDP